MKPITDTTRVLAVSVTERGRSLAARLPYPCRHGRVADAVREAWDQVDGLVLFVAVGAAVRIIGPLMAGKAADPAVVCVDEAGRFAVALLGGHRAGANRLADEVATALGAAAVITTATDTTGAVALDQLPGLTATGDLAGVTRAMLDGHPPSIANPRGWPLPPDLTFPPGPGVERGAGPERPSERGAGPERPSERGAGPERPSERGAGPERPSERGDRPERPSERGAGPRVLVTDEVVGTEAGRVVLHPPSLVVGVGASAGAPPAALAELVAQALRSGGLAPESVAELATIDLKAAEPAIVALGLPVRTWPAQDLAAVAVPNPSEVVRAAVGTPSVAEAAALAAAGPGASLVVPKRASATATVAVARRAHPRGHLALVGLGPGHPSHRTPAATAAVARAAVVIGYGPYLDQCADLLTAGHEVVRSPIGDEEVRAKHALAEAGAGRRVALVCSGDSGVFAMAAVTLGLLEGDFSRLSGDTEIEVVPGVTAALAAAALLGAPLGHDHAVISLSDLRTPWPAIEARLRAAADADLVVALYNPRSRGRTWQLDAARGILLTGRSPSTPVGVVSDAARTGERVLLTTLGDLDAAAVGMTTCVIVGSTATRMVAGRMVTPR